MGLKPMNTLYNAILGELENIDDNIQTNGLYVTIEGFSFYASFTSNHGYQLLNSHEAQQLIDLSKTSRLKHLYNLIQHIQDQWQDTLIADFECQQKVNGNDDINYHAMNAVNNWV
jgi:hypothetical protein